MTASDIPNHDTRPEFEKYKVNWTPVISPGGLIIYSGDMFPDWKGDAFIGGLSSQALVRVDINGTNAAKGDQWSWVSASARSNRGRTARCGCSRTASWRHRPAAEA